MSEYYWYFSTNDKCLRYGDGREIEAGITHTVDYEPVLCKQGLHASKRLLDALDYAPGEWVWLVKLGGTVKHDTDKSVATEREYVWGFDATDLLWEFARWCALQVIDEWNAPDVVRVYLETGREELRDAARDAAWDAAWAAARAAAWDASRAAARAASRAASRDAAWDAAWGGAWAAARAAAWDAAWAAQNDKLTEMVLAKAAELGHQLPK